MPYKGNKRHLLQLICMLMLLLVHLDTYGYNFICFFQNTTIQVPSSIASTDSFSTDGTQIEWSDPDYRSHSHRQTYSDYTTLYPDLIFSWLLKPDIYNTYPLFFHPLVIHKGIAVYLSHCLFII